MDTKIAMIQICVLALIFFAAFAQSCSGVGFGVIAAPALVRLHGYETAIVEAALLSWVIAIANAVHLKGNIKRHLLAILNFGLVPGLVLGVAVSAVLPTTVTLMFFGTLLVVLGLDSLYRLFCPSKTTPNFQLTEVKSTKRSLSLAGVFAGAAAYLFAAPGPSAAWALSKQRDLSSREIRSTIAAYFIVAYGAVLLLFFVLGRTANLELAGIAQIFVITVAGCLLGMLAGTRVPDGIIRGSVGLLVVLSGVSLLARV
jgi:uncharacterized protein